MNRRGAQPGNQIWHGRKHSPETIQKMRDAHVRRKRDNPESYGPWSKYWQGKKLSPEHKNEEDSAPWHP